jgi:hypothetical protein
MRAENSSNLVLRLASAGMPRDTEGLLLGILEETRALRAGLAEGLAAQVAGQNVSECPVPVWFLSNLLHRD